MPELLWNASARIDIVTLPERTVIAFDGGGPPDGDVFPRAVGVVHGIGHALRAARKAEGREFAIGPLEARWWAEFDGIELRKAPRDTWRWRLRLAVPDDVSEGELSSAVGAATTRKGGRLEKSADALFVRLEHIPSVRAGRVLSVGPYRGASKVLSSLDRAIQGVGATPAHAHLEVYLSDPRQTSPAQLRAEVLREIQ